MKSPRIQAMAVGALSLTAIATPATAQFFDDGAGRMWHGSWGWGHMAMGGIVMFLFWGGLIALVVLVIRGLSGRGSGRHDLPSAASPRAAALDVLEERFARGEISHEEFEERRRVLLTSRDQGGRPRPG